METQTQESKKPRYKLNFRCQCGFEWQEVGDSMKEVCDQVTETGCPVNCQKPEVGKKRIFLTSHVDTHVETVLPPDELIRFVGF